MTQEKKHDPDCIFCKIISEEFPCFKVFENENILAFLDIFPVNLGHIIIVPKEHHENIYQIDEESLIQITKLSKMLATRLKNKLDCPGVNILQNNGKASGQEVSHYHMHIIPRFENDKMELNFNSNPAPIQSKDAQIILNKLLN